MLSEYLLSPCALCFEFACEGMVLNIWTALPYLKLTMHFDAERQSSDQRVKRQDLAPFPCEKEVWGDLEVFQASALRAMRV